MCVGVCVWFVFVGVFLRFYDLCKLVYLIVVYMFCWCMVVCDVCALYHMVCACAICEWCVYACV